MLERGFWSNLWSGAKSAVESVVTVFVDVVVPAVTWVIEVVVESLESIAAALKEAMSAIGDMLLKLAGEMLRGLIGCNPLPAAQKLTNGVTGALTTKLSNWVKDWVFGKIEAAGFEREEKSNAMREVMTAVEKRMEPWQVQKQACLVEKEKKDPLYLAIAEKRDQCVAKLGGKPDDDALAYATKKGHCLATFREAIVEWDVMAEVKLHELCPELGARPTLTPAEKAELKAAGAVHVGQSGSFARSRRSSRMMICCA